MKNKIVWIFICILLIVTILPVSANIIVDKTNNFTIFSNTLYVGGSGPNNYTKIQDAIDISSDGDTVFVYDDSSPYYENPIIKKQIRLIGEDKNTTIIDGKAHVVIVYIYYGVLFSGFTIRNGEYGIKIIGSKNNISGNIIISGVSNYSSDSIEAIGINVEGSNNDIIGNVISKNENNNSIIFASGIYAIGGNLTIQENIIYNTKGIMSLGVWISGSSYIDITENSISYTNGAETAGIFIEGSKYIKITKNNFIKNKRNAVFYNSLNDIKTIVWDKNYWDKTRTNPFFIWGKRYITSIDLDPLIPGYELSIWIPWFQFDKNPASEPYDI